MKVGIDTVEVERFKGLSNTFLNRVYTDEELAYAKKFKNIEERLAGFFCAKEALLKALEVDISKLSLKDIAVEHNSYGVPSIKVSGEVLKILGQAKVSLSISHSKMIATVIVIIE